MICCQYFILPLVVFFVVVFLFVCFLKKAPFAFWELSQMHPGSAAEPQVKAGGQAFLILGCFPMCYPMRS